MTFYNKNLQFPYFFTLVSGFLLQKFAVSCLFCTYLVTFYDESLQFLDVFLLYGDNKYFQVCQFLKEFRKY